MPTKNNDSSMRSIIVRNTTIYSGYLINQTRLNNGLLIRPGKGGSASDFTAIATGESALPLAEQTAIISEVKAAVAVRIPVLTPTGLSSSSITTTGFTVSWSGAVGATSYTYTFGGVPATPSSSDVSGKTATFSGLTAGTAYAVIVTAVNSGGSTSSSSFIVTTRPSAPTGLSSDNITTTGFRVSWTGGDGATSYTYILTSSSATPSNNDSVSTKTATFTNLYPGINYVVYVTAVNSGGSSTSQYFIITTASTPTPTNLSSSHLTPTGFTVSWSGGSGATSYIYTLNSSNVTLLNPDANGVYNDEGALNKYAMFGDLTPETVYNVIVTAVNSSGSIPSSVLIVTTPPLPLITKSIQFSPNGYVDSELSTNFTLGSGDFTIEFWARTPRIINTLFSLLSVKGSINIDFITKIGTESGISINIDTIGSFWMGDGISSTYDKRRNLIYQRMKINTWYHIAIVRNGSVLKVYINGLSMIFESAANGSQFYEGIPLGTFNQTGNAEGKSYIVLHDPADGTRSFDGVITNVRIVKGTAVYTTNFTVPAIPLQSISNTVLLLNVASSETYLTDSSPTNATMTATGTVTYSST